MRQTGGLFSICQCREAERIFISVLFHLGVPEYLSTEICTSKQKQFPLVTFLDTPGLVDGDMKYPFDVEAALIWFGKQDDIDE